MVEGPSSAQITKPSGLVYLGFHVITSSMFLSPAWSFLNSSICQFVAMWDLVGPGRIIYSHNKVFPIFSINMENKWGGWIKVGLIWTNRKPHWENKKKIEYAHVRTQDLLHTWTTLLLYDYFYFRECCIITWTQAWRTNLTYDFICFFARHNFVLRRCLRLVTT